MRKRRTPFYIRGRHLWNARDARSGLTRDNWKDGVTVVVHHTADAYRGGSFDDEVEHLRAMQHFHQRVRGWSDIGYNYVIFPSGRVFEARGFGVRGAHVLNHNTDSCGISFVGDYTHREPTPAAVQAYAQLRQRLTAHGARLTRTYAHGDLMSTACPGRGVRQAINLPQRRAA